jgi:PAT family beta-lactamase induction signal transducer AmpG
LFYHATFLPRTETERQSVGALFRIVVRFRTFLVGLVLALTILLVRQIVASAVVKVGWDWVSSSLPFLSRISVSGWIAIAFLSLLLILLASLERIRSWIRARDSFYASAFVDFLSQKYVGRILAFVVLFRTGESFLLKMRYAFLRDIGMSMKEFGIAGGTVGVIVSLSATMLGGYLISKQGLERWIWPFVLGQNVLQLLYMGVAYYYVDLGHAAAGSISIGVLVAVIAVEAFGSGLGTAVFMVYIMRCCRPAYKAAHMAILTALMSLSFTIAGVLSGFLAEWMGFTLYFGFTFLAAVPGMILIFFVPYLDGTCAADLDGVSE